MKVAKELCRLLVKFAPIIRSLEAYTPAVGTAMDAAMAACSALHEALEELRELGD
jgi:hypothetical protein